MDIIDSDFEYISNGQENTRRQINNCANKGTSENNHIGSIDPDFEYIFPGRSERKKRSYLFRPNYLYVLTEDKFFKRFRMNKASFSVFLNKIRHRLEPNSER